MVTIPNAIPIFTASCPRTRTTNHHSPSSRGRVWEGLTWEPEQNGEVGPQKKNCGGGESLIVVGLLSDGVVLKFERFQCVLKLRVLCSVFLFWKMVGSEGCGCEARKA